MEKTTFFFPLSLSAPIPALQINHLLPAPSPCTLSLKGGKERERQRQRKRTRGDTKRKRGLSVHDWHPQLPRLGYQGAMATSAPHSRLALSPPLRSVDVKCSMPLSFPKPAVHRSLIPGWRHLGNATATKNYL